MIDDIRPQVPDDRSFVPVSYSLFTPWISLWVTSSLEKMAAKYHADTSWLYFSFYLVFEDVNWK